MKQRTFLFSHTAEHEGKLEWAEIMDRTKGNVDQFLKKFTESWKNKQRIEEISEEEETKRLIRQKKTKQAKLKKWRNQYLSGSIGEVLIKS